MQPPPLICQYDGTINDCHTSGRFDPPFSWEMPVPSHIFQKINKLYEKGSSAVEGKQFDLDILMGGDMKFLQLGACTKSGMCCFSVVPLIGNSDG
jgi:hypothetical protein